MLISVANCHALLSMWDIQGCDTVFVTSTGRAIDLAMAWIMVSTLSFYVFSRDCQMILVGWSVATCNVRSSMRNLFLDTARCGTS